MAVLVTGGTGLIGSNVARLLVVEHGQDVVVIDRLGDAPTGSVISDLKDRVTYVQGTVTDLSLLLRTIQQHKVEYVVHSAAIVAGAASARPIEALETNIVGTGLVLEAARIAGLRRVIALSSSAVMGSPEDLVTPRAEDDIVMPPTGLYPMSKLACEHLVHTYRQIYGVDTAIIRPRSVYGPGPWSIHHGMPVPRAIQAVVNGEPLTRATGADTSFDLTYVKDEANGIIGALLHDGPLHHYVYNVSQGKNVSMGQVFEVLRQLFPSATIDVGPGLWEGILARGEQKDATYRSSQRPPQDISRASADFGYRPEWPVERAVPDYVRWLQEGSYGSAH